MIILKIEETLSRCNTKKNKQKKAILQKKTNQLCRREGGFASKFVDSAPRIVQGQRRKKKEIQQKLEMKQNNITNAKPIFS